MLNIVNMVTPIKTDYCSGNYAAELLLICVTILQHYALKGLSKVQNRAS